MILFWNTTYYSQMAIDQGNMNDFKPPLPVYYWVVNYLVGLVFVCSFVIGISLNPFVIMFNWTKKTSPLSLLFILTAVADTVVCIAVPMFYAVLMLQTRIIFYNYMYEMYIVCVMCTFGCTSQVTTTMLGVVRFIKVQNPFFTINNKYMIIYLLLHVGYMFIQVIFIILLILGKLENKHNAQFIMVMACFIISALHCFVGSFCSGLTILKLWLASRKDPENARANEEKLRSAVTIFLMNIPHFVTAGCIFTSVVSPSDINWFDINFIFCPIFTSTLNPILIVTRGTAIKQMIRNKLRGVTSEGSIFRSNTRSQGYTETTAIKNSTAF